jgi:hypothetical protein
MPPKAVPFDNDSLLWICEIDPPINMTEPRWLELKVGQNPDQFQDSEEGHL